MNDISDIINSEEMNNFKFIRFNPSVSLQRGWRFVLPLVFVSIVTLMTSCSNDDDISNLMPWCRL